MEVFLGHAINLTAPWLLGVGGVLGLVLILGLLYLKKHQDHEN